MKSVKLQQWLTDQGPESKEYYQLFSILNNALERKGPYHFLKIMVLTQNDQVEKIRFLLKNAENWVGPGDYYKEIVYTPDFANNYNT